MAKSDEDRFDNAVEWAVSQPAHSSHDVFIRSSEQKERHPVGGHENAAEESHGLPGMVPPANRATRFRVSGAFASIVPGQ
jgi:hypothetical protein